MGTKDIYNRELSVGDTVVCVSDSSRMLPYCSHPAFKPRKRRNPRPPVINKRDNLFIVLSKTFNCNVENAKLHYDNVPANNSKSYKVGLISNGYIQFENSTECRPYDRLMHFHPANRFKKINQ